MPEAPLRRSCASHPQRTWSGGSGGGGDGGSTGGGHGGGNRGGGGKGGGGSGGGIGGGRVGGGEGSGEGGVAGIGGDGGGGDGASNATTDVCGVPTEEMASPVALLRVVAASEADRALCAAFAIAPSGTTVMISSFTLPADTLTVM